jgi:hypothetical protein
LFTKEDREKEIAKLVKNLSIATKTGKVKWGWCETTSDINSRSMYAKIERKRVILYRNKHGFSAIDLSSYNSSETDIASILVSSKEMEDLLFWARESIVKSMSAMVSINHYLGYVGDDGEASPDDPDQMLNWRKT